MFRNSGIRFSLVSFRHLMCVLSVLDGGSYQFGTVYFFSRQMNILTMGMVQ